MKHAIHLLFLFALPLYAADDIFDTVDGHACFREILRKSGWGLAGPYERAAFVIEQSDGSIACAEWPSMHTYVLLTIMSSSTNFIIVLLRISIATFREHSIALASILTMGCFRLNSRARR